MKKVSPGLPFFNRVKQVSCVVARSNKQWVGTCLYHKWDKLTHDMGYEQVAKRIENIRFDYKLDNANKSKNITT